MIEPVFVGLLAAAFAFLYAELSRVMRYIVDKAERKEAVDVFFQLRDEQAYEGVEGILNFICDYLEMLGSLLAILFVPLVSYLSSIVLLFIGYGLGIGFFVFLGVVLLAEAFVVSGCLLATIYGSAEKAVKDYAKRVKEKFPELMKEARDNKGTE